MSATPGRPRGLRLLPVTIGALALLLSVKTVGLIRLALGTEARAATGTESPHPLPAQTPAPPPAPARAPAPGAAPSPATSGPCAGPADISASERALLLDLRQRREALDVRARQQDARKALIDAAEHRLSARVDELQALQTRLEQLDAARIRHEEANWQGLVKLYEQMKPRDAAVIFNDLDMQVLLPVIDRMKEIKAAPILAAMQPEKARAVTAALAHLRVNETTPAAAGPSRAAATIRP